MVLLHLFCILLVKTTYIICGVLLTIKYNGINLNYAFSVYILHINILLAGGAFNFALIAMCLWYVHHHLDMRVGRGGGI